MSDADRVEALTICRKIQVDLDHARAEITRVASHPEIHVIRVSADAMTASALRLIQLAERSR